MPWTAIVQTMFYIYFHLVYYRNLFLSKGPIQNGNQWISLYFIFSAVCLGFIMVNLFIGVLCYYFGTAQSSNKSNNLFLTFDQKLWISIQKYIPTAKPEKSKKEKKKENKNSFLKKVIESRYFDMFIMCCIISNALIISMSHEGASAYYNSVLENCNYAFTAIFVFECLLKIIDMGFISYIKDGWNRLDFVIVFLSLLDIFIEYVLGGSSNKLIRLGPQIIRIFRIVRVVRVLQLIKRLKSLKKILESLIISLPDILNVAILLFLFYFIYAVLAVFLFKDIKTGVTIDKYNNFWNFFSSCMTLLGLISGQTWTVIMLDCFNLPPNCIPGQTCGTCNFFLVSQKI